MAIHFTKQTSLSANLQKKTHTSGVDFLKNNQNLSPWFDYVCFP